MGECEAALTVVTKARLSVLHNDRRTLVASQSVDDEANSLVVQAFKTYRPSQLHSTMFARDIGNCSRLHDKLMELNGFVGFV